MSLWQHQANKNHLFPPDSPQPLQNRCCNWMKNHFGGLYGGRDLIYWRCSPSYKWSYTHMAHNCFWELFFSYIPTNPNNPGCYNHSFLVASTSNPITFPTFAEQLSLQVFSSTSTSETILHRGARYSTSCQVSGAIGSRGEALGGLRWIEPMELPLKKCGEMLIKPSELPFWWGKWNENDD